MTEGAVGNEGECLLIIAGRCHDAGADSQRSEYSQIVERFGGRLLPDNAGDWWFQQRFSSAGGLMESRNAAPGRVFDTIEISVPWSRAADCFDELQSTLEPACTTLYQHASHAYVSGVCLYLMLFIEQDSDAEALETLSACWDRAMAIAEAHGGVVGHHHGIGAVRRDRYRDSSEGRVHARIKAALDPTGFFTNALFGRGDDLAELAP